MGVNKRNLNNSMFSFVLAKPYFILPLPDMHADIDSQVTWRCEAKSIPNGVYIWFKNGNVITSTPGDQEVVGNVMTIRVRLL